MFKSFVSRGAEGHTAIKNTLDFFEFTGKLIRLNKYIFHKGNKIFRNNLKHCNFFIFFYQMIYKYIVLFP